MFRAEAVTRSTDVRCWLYTAALVVVTAAALPLVETDRARGVGATVAWPVLALLFLVTAAVRGSGPRRLSLAALPTVIGLFCTPVGGIVAARALTALADRAVRTRDPMRTAAGTSIATLEVVVAVLAFQRLTDPGADPAAETWAGALAAVVAGRVVTALATLGARAVATGRIATPQPLRTALTEASAVVVATGLGLLAVAALAFDERSVWVLSAVVVLGGAGLMSYERLARHTDALVAERSTLLEQLHRAAAEDSLTGLPNLDSTRAALTAQLAERDGADVVVLLIDLDRFQDINDTFGHDAGDEVLREFARRLERAAPVGASVGRVGGDQFAVIWRSRIDPHVVHLVGVGLRAEVGGPVRVGTVSADVDLTVGVAHAPEHGADAGTLLRRAEMAMYAAKGTAEGFALWEPALEEDGARRLAIVRELRQALADDALTVVFHPKVRLSGGSDVIGLEALARWAHPTLGSVTPDEFIPLAETSGLIGPLTTAVLGRSLAACRRWHDLGLMIGVAVNVSARTLQDPWLVRQTAALLETYGVAPHWLTLELTETHVMDNPDRSIEILRQLRALGVRLSIDDFGTGYSSLNYVKGLPVHEVKIDKAFVPHIVDDRADRAVVRAVVDLGHSLGLEVVAEGVETASQGRTLAELGVDVMQGFHYALPMTAPDATIWLLDRAPTPTRR